MPSILAANALTTLQALLDELGLTTDGGAQDNLIERFINEASAQIVNFCGREFIRADNIAEKVKGRGTPKIRVKRRPIITIDSIAVSGTTVDSDDYYVEDADKGIIYRAAGWPNTALVMPTVSQAQMPGTEDSSEIVVTYDGGYVTPIQAAAGGAFAGQTRTLPWDVEGACIRAVATRWRARGTAADVEQESGQNSSRAFSVASPLPRAVMAMLAGYRVFPHA